MEERILQFLHETYPIHCDLVEAVTNEMYRCRAAEGGFFVRITNYKTDREQAEEVNWVNFLYHEGIGVPQPIPSRKGTFVEKVMLDEEKLAVVFQAAPGIHLPRSQWNSSIFRKLGQQMGRMHRASRAYTEREAAVYIKDWHDNDEYDFLAHIPREETVIRDMARDVLDRVNKLPRDPDYYGIIHGDLWLENILVDRDHKLTMIDFQDCEKHYYGFDLAVPIYSALEFSFAGKGNIGEYAQSIAGALIEGYQEENDLPAEVLQHMPIFMKLKELFEYNLMHMYWNRDELTEEQVRIMNLYRIRIEQNHVIKI
ncbi:phosphotransferase enzyme family protein [Paenibacillus spongiae]|uniref:Phosphotransferase n=1 Tax=Paenibacillus spongiae TaxID=2909671 RepID=A0ABY5SCH7_9BACL|nr:phosphotransferase [Paenibacillus spongiae]UVI30430.1 phosphotransferase [Paenibacillus spongiae]